MPKHLTSLIILFLAVLFASCSKNNDEYGKDEPDTPQVNEHDIEINTANLKGEWELYNYDKEWFYNSGKNSYKQRYIDFDGFSYIFFEGVDDQGKTVQKFNEKNAKGDVILTGTYTINSKKEFVFKTKAYDGVNDTTTYKPIKRLTDKRFITQERYIDKATNNFDVQDTKMWRNSQTMPNEHPGVNKLDITFSKLAGEWELVACEAYNGAGKWTEKEESIMQNKGRITRFEANGNFKKFDPQNTTLILPEGTFSIVDDLVYLFFKYPNYDDDGNIIKDPSGNPILFDKSQSIWITDWKGSGVGNETFVKELTYLTRVGQSKVVTKIQIKETYRRKS